MSFKKIDQKEYLKKYLSNDVTGEKKKKKKQSKRSVRKSTVKIIDDDWDLNKLQNAIDDEVFAALSHTEDAPQVVGIIDDRPVNLIADEKYKQSGKWKSMEEQDHCKDDGNRENGNISPTKSDQSPPRRKYRKKSSTPDNSPRRHKPLEGRNRADSDQSPPRRTYRKKSNTPESSPRRHKPSVHRNQADSDESPPRQKRKNESVDDLSPPRRHKGRRSLSISPGPSKKYDPKSRQYTKGNERRSKSSDLSPQRRQDTKYNRRNSQERRSSMSRRRNDKNDSFSSHKNRSRSLSKSPVRMKKTLDGKKAGLQNARALREELDEVRRRENEMFQTLSEEQTGKNAIAVSRDRKTGRIRDLLAEAAVNAEKEEKEKEKKKIYDQWGKGVKQVEDMKARTEEVMHEMSKPLARYAGDQDLEVHLREQERLGDPMLDYIRQKNKERNVKAGIPVKPLYQGPFPDNRYNIRPGYRWDGVDRSNGYEKKLFDVQSRKVAIQEEAYKYSCEDM